MTIDEPTLWTTDAILANRQLVRHAFPGIYFLIRDGEIVYVGQSTCNILERIVSHLRNKDFDSFTVIHMTSDVDLNAVEAAYVYALRPEYNKSMPPGSPHVSLQTLQKRLGLTWDETGYLVNQSGIQADADGYYDIRDLKSYVEGLSQ